jgi:CheY-like chemotaxis protein
MPKVMVVDDAYSELQVMETILRSAGYEVVTYLDGDELEEKIAKERPDVVLLDIRLPDMNGLEVSRQVRASESLQHTKVIAVSACAFPSDVSQALESGCHSFLQKPCLPDALVQEMNRLIQDQESTPPAS